MFIREKIRNVKKKERVGEKREISCRGPNFFGKTRRLRAGRSWKKRRQLPLM